MAVKVAELYAALQLRDTMTPDLAKAEAKAKAADGQRSTTVLDADVSALMSELDASEAKAKASGKRMADELADGIESGSGSLKSAGSGAGALFIAGAAGAVAAGGAVLVDQLGKAMDAETSKANLGISLGLSPEMSKAAGDLAGRVYADAFGESLDEVSNAVGSVGRNMGGFGTKAEGEVEDLTAGVLTLADVFDQDLNKVTAAAGTIMSTGMAKDGMQALDILTKGLQSSANKSDDLLDTFIEYPTVFRQLGITGPQALGLMSQALGAGARDADTVADSLKEFTILAQTAGDATTPAAEAFRTLGLDGKFMADSIAAGGQPAADALQMTMDKLAPYIGTAQGAELATMLFGTKAEDLQGALAAMDLSNADTQIGNVEGAMADATTATETNRTKLDEWKRSMETSVVAYINETAIPALEEMAEQWRGQPGLVNDFRTGVEDLGDGLRFLKDDVIDPVIGSLQSLAGWIETVSSKADDWNWLLQLGGPVTAVATGTGGDQGSDFIATMAGPILGPMIKNAQNRDVGGLVDGPLGSPQLLLAHGGEMVLPTHRMSPADAIRQQYGTTGATDGAGYGQTMTSSAAPGSDRPIIIQVMQDRREIGRAVTSVGRVMR